MKRPGLHTPPVEVLLRIATDIDDHPHVSFEYAAPQDYKVEEKFDTVRFSRSSGEWNMLPDLSQDCNVAGWIDYHRDPLLKGLPAEISLLQPTQTLGERLMLLTYLRPELSHAAFSLLYHGSQKSLRVIVPSHEIEEFKKASDLRTLERLS